MAATQTGNDPTAAPDFEGTWDDLLLRGNQFAGKRVRLSVVSNEGAAAANELAVIEAIKAVRGKYAYLGGLVEELHRERQRDKVSEERLAEGFAE